MVELAQEMIIVDHCWSMGSQYKPFLNDSNDVEARRLRLIYRLLRNCLFKLTNHSSRVIPSHTVLLLFWPCTCLQTMLFFWLCRRSSTPGRCFSSSSTSSANASPTMAWKVSHWWPTNCPIHWHLFSLDSRPAVVHESDPRLHWRQCIGYVPSFQHVVLLYTCVRCHHSRHVPG